MIKINSEEVKSFLQDKREILVVTHFSPDGDAIGSLLAISGILSQYSVPHVLAIDDPCPNKYSFLPGIEKIRNLKTEPLDRLFEKAIIVDAGALHRIGNALNYISKEAVTLNIDHHFTGRYFGNINLVDVNASATSEIIYEICNELNITITPQIAYGLYVGILTDTGRFRFSNTNGKSFAICGDLVTKGVNPSLVTDKIYYNIPFKLLTSLAWSIYNIDLHYDGLVSLITLDQDHHVADTEDFVEFASSIDGVSIAAFIYEIEDNVYKVSVRSRCRIDVSEVAKRFDGGGHRKASGFKFEGNYEDLKRTLLDEIGVEIENQHLKVGEPLMEMPPDSETSGEDWH